VQIGYEKSFETTPQQLRELKQMLEELVSPYVTSGKYRIFLNQPKPYFKTYKALLKFDNPDEGYSALERIQFAKIENHALSVKAELSSTVRYSTEVYTVVEKSIQEETNEIHSRYKSVRVDHGKKDDKNKIIVRITSEDVNTFIIAKHALNSVISPFVMNCSKPELREFIQTANCKRALEKIEAETSTYIRIDTRRATISIYGHESNITKAQIEFNKCLSFLDSGAKCYEVRSKEAGKPPGLMKHLVTLFGPGLRLLQEREGVTTVRLDPRRQLVTVFATQSVYEFLNGKIDEYTKSFDPNLLSTIHHHKPDEIECCACFTDIINSSDIFRLEYCGHTYCIDCMKLQLAPSTVDFPIVCAADGCSEPLVWKDIYNLSDQTGFSIRHLINASVRSYVAANQDKVRNCSSPDCSMIYSVTKEGKCFFCQQCGAMVCTTCHEPYHEGITCARYQSGKQADRDLEDWLQRDPSNRKRCPKCSSPLEKIYGCNHIICTQCRVHICWFCLDYFYSGTECYAHMSAKHGHIGL
jgi:ATP-dependent RNA helicase DHX8/PRP22